MSVRNRKLAVVIPAYRAAHLILEVVNHIPSYVDWIVIVNDASPDDLDQKIGQIADPRIVCIKHEENKGVGGAMVTGFKNALLLGADLIAKVDADGQMDPQYLDRFANVSILHNCDYVKANRFGHIEQLHTMPRLRFFGSICLSFLTKLSSGYWNVFDPQNGYIMITRITLRRLNLEKIDRGYFFENSMLINLNIIRARVGEIYIPAKYDKEISSMKLRKIIFTFPWKLMKGIFYRIYHKYIFRSLSPVALLLTFGILFLIWGLIVWYERKGESISTEDIILILFPLFLGWSTMIQSLILDVQDAGPCILFDYDDESLLLSCTDDEQITTA